MRVLVDSSAWIEFLNGHPSPEGRAVDRLLEGEDDVCTCGVVVAEVFQGLRRDKERFALERLFGEMTLLEVSGLSTYFRAADLYRSLRRRGVTVRSTIDCFIAVLAEENGCSLLFRDRDLRLVLSSGLLSLSAWP